MDSLVKKKLIASVFNLERCMNLMVEKLHKSDGLREHITAGDTVEMRQRLKDVLVQDILGAIGNVESNCNAEILKRVGNLSVLVADNNKETQKEIGLTDDCVENLYMRVIALEKRVTLNTEYNTRVIEEVDALSKKISEVDKYARDLSVVVGGLVKRTVTEPEPFKGLENALDEVPEPTQNLNMSTDGSFDNMLDETDINLRNVCESIEEMDECDCSDEECCELCCESVKGQDEMMDALNNIDSEVAELSTVVLRLEKTVNNMNGEHICQCYVEPPVGP